MRLIYCTYGFYFYNTNSVSGSAEILSNKIHNNSNDGIYLYRSSPAIRENKIYNNPYGVYCIYFSSPYFGQLHYLGRNRFYSNSSSAIYAEFGSNPFLGYSNPVFPDGGYNHFDNSNGKHVMAAYLGSTVMAEMNWWGSDPPEASKFVTDPGTSIDYTPYLHSPVFGGSNGTSGEKVLPGLITVAGSKGSPSGTGLLGSADDILIDYDKNWPIKQKLYFARTIIYLGYPDRAQQICKKIIKTYPDSSLSFFALDILWEASRKKKAPTNLNLSAFQSYLSTLAKTKKGEYKDIHGHAELILAGFEGERGLSRINRIANDYRGETLGECALFQKFMYYFSGKEDREKAYQVLERLKEFYPESMLVSEAQGLLKNMVIHLAKGNVGKVSAESVSVPSKSELFGNYPNPFNLTTVIKYSLEENTKVSLKIFNILG